MMTLLSIQNIISRVHFRDWKFHVSQADTHPYLQIHFTDKDGIVQHGRKWLLSCYMTKSELVQTAFLAVQTALMHECREDFLYLGRPILGPHYDIDALYLVCEPHNFDVRPRLEPA